ncbi:hypothetical protein BS78_05G144800 [Paspalum vaginatum]|uniref:Uncharacterized protein n=1 Tax=Paspalum vaginatum TaxID=158149 RepID=A0A9W7X7I4_9POAL|nr:hypothetical protein BS78_K344200 [Paspalum vaginatum]KAJ1275558.1 hypothetical protein BS78_05G144800 [Paspalum vaginatum]
MGYGGHWTRRAPSWLVIERSNTAACFCRPTRRWSISCPNWLKLLSLCAAFPRRIQIGPIQRLSDCQDDLNDSADGGGAPLYPYQILESCPRSLLGCLLPS